MGADTRTGISDITGVRPSTPLGERLLLWPWDLYMAACALVSAVVALQLDGTATERGITATSILGLGAWYYAGGRRHIRRESMDAPALFPVVTIAIFIVGLWFHPASPLAWGLVFPMIFLCCSSGPAAIWSAAAALLPALILLLRDGPNSPGLPSLSVIGISAGGTAILLGLWIRHIIVGSLVRDRLIEELEESRRQVDRISREAGAATERTRLAEEIHDTLAQGFASIVTLVQAAESELDSDLPAARRHLDLTTATARENLAEARAMVAALAPVPLSAGTLAEAIRHRAELTAEQCGAIAEVHLADIVARPTATEVVVLRAAQEALSNIAKHARAGHIAIELVEVGPTEPDPSEPASKGTCPAEAAARLRLTVTDDGVGFDPDARHDGFGHAGMRSRAEEVGGRVVLRSTPGAGTTVTVEVP